MVGVAYFGQVWYAGENYAKRKEHSCKLQLNTDPRSKRKERNKQKNKEITRIPILITMWRTMESPNFPGLGTNSILSVPTLLFGLNPEALLNKKISCRWVEKQSLFTASSVSYPFRTQFIPAIPVRKPKALWALLTAMGYHEMYSKFRVELVGLWGVFARVSCYRSATHAFRIEE